ncbi:hypothetical protein D6D01_09347 [Aureobasidium pullulans]|uniref:Uncharacterized protein n=1 Tax=Aureobasidium pullulans TaxID=5580 RepID=A0A4S9K5T8_AURPU|nr:hypothetical protein D6D01_09347 [Aureobasidium pullulans]
MISSRVFASALRAQAPALQAVKARPAARIFQQTRGLKNTPKLREPVPKEEHSAHTISQRIRTLRKIPPELIPIGTFCLDHFSHSETNNSQVSSLRKSTNSLFPVLDQYIDTSTASPLASPATRSSASSLPTVPSACTDPEATTRLLLLPTPSPPTRLTREAMHF